MQCRIQYDITGVVYNPAGKNPLPDILVYVPQAALSAFTDGVNTSTPVKDSYAALVTGNPLVSMTTGADGSFSLSGLPAGTGVPLVIQAGRRQRQFVISSVAACTTTALYSTAGTTVGTDPADLSTSNVVQGGSSSLSGYGESTALRFARNQNEGDIPRIAFVTGASDALECTIRKVGIDDSEFSDPNVGINSTSSNSAVSGSSPPGRVSLFQRNTGGGAKAPKYSGAASSVSTVQTGYELFDNTSVLDGYNVLMLPCAGKADTALETGGADIADAQKYLMFLAVLFGSRTSYAQSVLETAISYNFSYANTTSPHEFWQNGGAVELHGQFLKGLGAVVRLDVLHTSNMEGTNVGLDLFTAAFGPRYTWARKKGRVRCYGEALGGWTRGFNSEFPTQSGVQSTADSGAFLLGGGVNYGLSKRVGIRILDAHWMRTYLPNATTGEQNTLLAGTGIVIPLP